MIKGLSEPLLSEISRLLADHTGLHFPAERWPDLERGIRSAAPSFGCEDGESCARFLLSSPLTRRQIEILAGELTVGETYFFREKQSLEVLSDRILPELVRVRRGTDRRLRIWSAGCCTGEEPYSIAILLDRFLPELRDWQVTILGTDLNPLFLNKASKGIYSEWSFRDAPPWLKENYFKPAGVKHFEIAPRIRERVTFSYLNLGEEVYPSLATNTNAMDLILCRNVLMYFSPERTKKVTHRFHQSLVTGGWLLVSPTETSCELFGEFSSVQFQRTTFYQKGEKPLPAAVPHFSPEAAFLHPEPADISPSVLSFVSAPSFPAPPPEPSASPAAETAADPYEEARILFERGNYAAAAAMLKADPALLPATAERSALLARICANLGELSEALSWAEKALAVGKLDAGLHYLRAMILQEQGSMQEVVPSLKRALYLAPNFVLAHYALGNLALRQRNFKEAGRHFANVLALLDAYKPNDVLPDSDGLAAGRLREMVESAQLLEKAA
jgi:chemotaxis protein methyltransferase CheR